MLYSTLLLAFSIYANNEIVLLAWTVVESEDDGSWTIVVAGRDPGHPNWISTAGHPRGLLWFRWFHPAATPERASTEVVTLP